MPYVIVTPESMTATATEIATIGSTLEEAHQVVAPSILAVAPAAADEVSAAIAQLFSEQAQEYQQAAAEATAYQERFVQNLQSSAESYAGVEELIASLLRGLHAEVAYYDNARLALGQMLTLFALQDLFFTVFPLFWALLPLLPFLQLTQLSSLITNVLFRQPIPYPYTPSF